MIGKAGTAKLALANDDEVRTKSVIVAENVTKRFGERTIIKNFTLRIQRGDRIGVVGANGTGKTTLLKLLTGELAPDEGSVTLAKTLHGVMIDQQRSLMAGDKRVRDVLAEGGDWIDVRGAPQARPGLTQGVPVRSRPGRHADLRAVGRRAVTAAAGARVRAEIQPAGARRADQ
jgi:ATPase subunit of ABC transporter with duplicated ATPase domains